MAVNRDTIDQYYQHRELVEPNSTEALLWLITEVAELAQAYLAYVMQYEDAAEAVGDYDRSLSFYAPEYAAIQRLIKFVSCWRGHWESAGKIGCATTPPNPALSRTCPARLRTCT